MQKSHATTTLVGKIFKRVANLLKEIEMSHGRSYWSGSDWGTTLSKIAFPSFYCDQATNLN